MGRLLTSGVDVWLNTPLPPMEASGTSGMKAALNGVPSLSVLDGWWIEGCIEGITGWAIDGVAGSQKSDAASRTPLDAASLYRQLEQVVVALCSATTVRNATPRRRGRSRNSVTGRRSRSRAPNAIKPRRATT